MPPVSKAQNRLMQGAAHNKAFAKKVHVPVKVAKEFAAAAHGKSLAKLPERKKK